MKRIAVSVGCAAFACSAAFAGMWRGLSEADHYSGPKLTEADLAGKVVLVDCWGVNCPPCRALLPRIEQIWQSFKSKPFVVVGSHCQGRQPERVAELVKANKLTYPMYERFGLAEGEPRFSGIPFLYVVNHRGKVVYSGHGEREATEALVTAIGQVGAPPSLTGGVFLKKYKSLEKQLVLGKDIRRCVKTLESDLKRMQQARNPNAALKAQMAEASGLLKAIEEGKEDAKREIDAMRTADPEEALVLVKAFMASFPEDGAVYKSELPDLTAAAKAAKAEKAAKAKEAAKAKGARR